MIEIDVLLTLAELAVGLIGVSGIVAVFPTKGRLHPADQLRFISIVVNGMLVVVFALVPIWTNWFAEDEESLWRFSSSTTTAKAPIISPTAPNRVPVHRIPSCVDRGSVGRSAA